jgi:hypothetical protein
LPNFFKIRKWFYLKAYPKSFGNRVYEYVWKKYWLS